MSITPSSGNMFHHPESAPQTPSSSPRVETSTHSSIGAHPDHQQENPTANESSCCSRFSLQAIGAWIIWFLTCGFCNCFPCSPSQTDRGGDPEDSLNNMPPLVYGPENISGDDMPPLMDDSGNIFLNEVPLLRDHCGMDLSLPEPEQAPSACFSPSPTADFFNPDAYQYVMDKLIEALLLRPRNEETVSDCQVSEDCTIAARQLISNLIKGQVITVSSDVDTLIINRAFYLASLEKNKMLAIRDL